MKQLVLLKYSTQSIQIFDHFNQFQLSHSFIIILNAKVLIRFYLINVHFKLVLLLLTLIHLFVNIFHSTQIQFPLLNVLLFQVNFIRWFLGKLLLSFEGVICFLINFIHPNFPTFVLIDYQVLFLLREFNFLKQLAKPILD